MQLCTSCPACRPWAARTAAGCAAAWCSGSLSPAASRSTPSPTAPSPDYSPTLQSGGRIAQSASGAAANRVIHNNGKLTQAAVEPINIFYTEFQASSSIATRQIVSNGLRIYEGDAEQEQRRVRREHTVDRCGGTKVWRTQLEVRALAAQLRTQLVRQAVGAQGVPAPAKPQTRSRGCGRASTWRRRASPHRG